MSGMSSEEAREVISRHLVWTALDTALMGGLIDWSDFPDIGEHDWADIVVAARGKAAGFAATEGRFKAAYAVLAARANREAS